MERAKSAENNLNDALEREIDARVDTDRSLENTIDANDRTSKERNNKLQGNIDANDTASKDRDTQLQANIDAEIANRGNAENAINDRITNEVNERKADNTSINTRIDKEAEERKNDVTSLATRVDTEQTERVKADNAFDKRVTDNTQAIEHETERAKSAETNLNDALEREVDARQDDTRNLENQIDKVSTDSAKRDGVLQANIDIESNKRATEDNKKVSVTNVKSAIGSHITVTTSNENTENATVTIGDTFDTDFKKVGDDIETEKQRAIAKENELSGKVEHETQERQTETNTLNAEVAKRPTLDKFIAGDNITLTPDVDKTTLTINANGSNKLLSDDPINTKESNNFMDFLSSVIMGERNISVSTYVQENKPDKLLLSVPYIMGSLYIKDNEDKNTGNITLTLDFINLYKDIEAQYEKKHALYSPDNSIKILEGGNGKYGNLVLNKDALPKIPTLVGKEGISVTEDKEHNLINITNVANITQLKVNANSRYKANESIFISFKELGLDSVYVINAFFAIKEAYWQTAYISSDSLEIPATVGGYKLDLVIYYTNVVIEKSLQLL